MVLFLLSNDTILHHVMYATNRESVTSRGVYISRQTNSNYTHQGVISSSRRQDSSAAGPRRSCSAFWRQKKISTNIYGGSQVLAPTFGRGPGPGPVMVPAIVSHGLPALRPLYNSQEGIAITVESPNFKRCFGYVLQWLNQVDPKGFFDVSNTFLMPSSGWNQRA